MHSRQRRRPSGTMAMHTTQPSLPVRVRRLRKMPTRATVVIVLAMASTTLASPAGAHAPGTDGGPANRGCKPIESGRIYVGATRVSCSIARQVAAGVRSGKSFERWKCTWSSGRVFGHCHGRGIRKGAVVHWAAND